MQQFVRGIAFAAAVGATIVAAACGGEKTPGSPDTPSGPSTIRGAEQLAWDQAEQSWPRLGTYTFFLYVDGALQGPLTAQCSQTQNSRGFPCTARLPTLSAGTHMLQLNAVVAGRESGLSAALEVTVQRSTTSDEPSSISETAPAVSTGVAPSSTGAAANATVCTDANAECFSVQAMLTTDRAITAAAVTPDGRLLIVENGQSIRVRTTRGLEPEPAFVANRPAMRIVDVAVDPTFAATQAVYVAWTDERDSRRRMVNISRLRLVDNRLGQEAAIVVDLPLPALGAPQIAQDALGRLYLAVPASDASRSARDPYNGTLLRFTSDGTVPWGSGQTSPMLAGAPGQPLAMSVGANGLTVWLAGRVESASSELMIVEPRNGSEALMSLGRLTSQSKAASETPSEIVAVAEIRQSTTAQSPIVVADDRGALWLVTEPSSPGQLSATRIPFTYGKALKLSSGLASDVYVIAVIQAKSTPVFGVIRLAPLQNTGR